MIEDDLRAAFARHETLAPPTGPLRAAIDRVARRRRRRRLRLRLGGTALALVAATLVGFTALAPPPPAPSGQVAAPTSPAPTGALNVLLLGVDAAGGGRRADSVLLVHVPADRSRLYLVSIPRDLPVPLPGGGRDKLNVSFAAGAGKTVDLAAGYRNTRQVVAQLVGVPIDAGAVLTYPATRELTDAVGGVPVCLPAAVRSVHTDRLFPAGCQRLGGAAAVDLLRQRYRLRDGALDRDRNAGRYAAGLLRRIQEQGVLTDPARLNRLLGQVGPELVTDTGETSLLALLAVAGKAAGAEPVAVSLPVRFEERGPYPVGMDPALAPGFLAALREDGLAGWTAAHPDQVTSLR